MTIRTGFLTVALTMSMCANVLAQQDGTVAPGAVDEPIDIAEEMRAAEARLEEAARRIAELSAQHLPAAGGRRWAFAFSDRPMLGITIDGSEDKGPVKGPVIRGVTPGGAASEAGLRAGDTITSINKETMSAANSEKANQKLLDFMEGIEEGDTVDVEYMRSGKVATVEVKPRASAEHHFAFGVPGQSPMAPVAPRTPFVHRTPGAPGQTVIREVFRWRDGMAWRDMELVPLTPDLGRYFGTEKGLLVVRAPQGGELQLKDGDVIQSIGGREPASISHAMRILDSYQPGESVKLEIMRDKRRRTLDVELPENRQSRMIERAVPGLVNAQRQPAAR